MLTKWRLRGAVLVAVVLASPSSLAVSDLNLLPGSTCVAAGGSHQAELNYANGQVRNVGESAVDVVCPLVIEVGSAHDVSLDLRLYFGAYDTISCIFECCPHGSGSCRQDSYERTMGPSGGYTTASQGPVDSYDSGACVVHCSLDPGSRVAFYEWEEVFP